MFEIIILVWSRIVETKTQHWGNKIGDGVKTPSLGAQTNRKLGLSIHNKPELGSYLEVVFDLNYRRSFYQW